MNRLNDLMKRKNELIFEIRLIRELDEYQRIKYHNSLIHKIKLLIQYESMIKSEVFKWRMKRKLMKFWESINLMMK